MVETMQQLKPSLVSKAYEGRLDFQNTWEKMSRKTHTYWLAQPTKKALMSYPDPKFYVPVPRPITKAALNYRPTERINLMSTPKEDKITPKLEKQEFKDTTQVEPAALLAVASPRLIELAKPPVRDVSKKKAASKGKKGKRLRRKHKGSKRTAEQKEAWLLRCSAPKKWPPPHHPHPNKPRFVMHGNTKLFIKERKRFTILTKEHMKISKSELMRRMVHLSIPSRRREKFRWSVEKDDFTGRRAKMLAQAQNANGTIRKLALPKPIQEETLLDLKYNPFKINKGTLNYKATARINILSTPVQKKARVDSDVKENPFGVVKRALKAVCSKRVAELAQPFLRD